MSKDKQMIGDLRLYIGYTETDQTRLTTEQRQSLQDAKIRIERCPPAILLNAFMEFRSSGLSPLQPTFERTMTPEREDIPRRR